MLVGCATRRFRGIVRAECLPGWRQHTHLVLLAGLLEDAHLWTIQGGGQVLPPVTHNQVTTAPSRTQHACTVVKHGNPYQHTHLNLPVPPLSLSGQQLLYSLQVETECLLLPQPEDQGEGAIPLQGEHATPLQGETPMPSAVHDTARLQATRTALLQRWSRDTRTLPVWVEALRAVLWEDDEVKARVAPLGALDHRRNALAVVQHILRGGQGGREGEEGRVGRQREAEGGEVGVG